MGRPGASHIFTWGWTDVTNMMTSYHGMETLSALLALSLLVCWLPSQTANNVESASITWHNTDCIGVSNQQRPDCFFIRWIPSHKVSNAELSLVWNYWTNNRVAGELSRHVLIKDKIMRYQTSVHAFTTEPERSWPRLICQQLAHWPLGNFNKILDM